MGKNRRRKGKRRVKARRRRKKGKKRDKKNPRKIFIGTLPFGTSEKQLRTFFKDCGTIEHLELPNKIAFLTFKTDAGYQNALKLHGSELGGEQLKVTEATEKE